MFSRKLFLFLLIAFQTLLAYPQNGIVTGRITDLRTGKPLQYASISVKDGVKGAITSKDGTFRLALEKGETVLQFSMLGYVPQEKAVVVGDSIRQVDAFMVQADLRIKDLVVTAKRSSGITSTSRIGEAAIGHLQASSLADVMQLLPGMLSRDGSIANAQQLNLRQIKTDNNTALGTAIVVDGAPISNDANMQVNNTAGASEKYSTVAAGGVDVRSITTDRLQEVEVIRGIPSAQYGEVTGGMMILKSKTGETPLYIRIKSEPALKLVSVGKGVALTKGRGVVNVDFDYARSYSDLRTPYIGYDRYTSQLGWARTFAKRELQHKVDAKLGLSYSSDVRKSDPELITLEEKYSSTEKGIRLNAGGTLSPKEKGTWQLTYRLSGSYAHQESMEKKIVALKGPQPLALSRVSGEYEGIYLPSEYYAKLLIDGKPLNLAANASLTNRFKLLGLRHKLLTGVDIRTDANLGAGQVFDPTRPPLANTLGATRPRAYHSLPWMKKGALFVEDEINVKMGQSVLQLQGGVRLNTYHAAGKTSAEGTIFVEPRFNMRYLAYSNRDNGWCHLLAVRAGAGTSSKTPTLLHLYPDKDYEDIVELNYFSQNEAKRLLWVNTKVRETTNRNIKPVKTTKWEAGIDWDNALFSTNITLFHEVQKNGFDFRSTIFPIIYKEYDNSSYNGSSPGKPSISDFKWSPDTLFTGITTPVNSIYTLRKGIEYALSSKRIEAINTSIIVDGAFFYQKTRPDSRTYSYPAGRILGEPYRYVGIFDKGEESTYKQLNTNLRIVTNIPAYRLIVSCVIQNVWFSSVRYGKRTGLPRAYLDLAGVEHPFTADMANDPYMGRMVEKYSDYYFNERRVPMMTEVNLRLTKEFWKNAQVSMLVNRIAEYKPSYKLISGTKVKVSSIPFFGVELKVGI